MEKISGSVPETQHHLSKIRHLVKMARIGQMASSIAHDSNSYLMVVLGHLAEMRRKFDDEELTGHITEAENAAIQMARLTRSLLTCSHKNTPKKEAVDLNLLVTDTLPMLETLIQKKVALSLTTEQVVVWVDRGQLQEVLLNLGKNAQEAMPNGGGVTIRTKSSNGLAVLEVSDTGVGIAPEILPHIFEPFFTTKEPDKGTGLGLAMVNHIVKESEGDITVSSVPGEGTTFTIVFPELRREAV